MNAPLRVDPDRLTRLVWRAVASALVLSVGLAAGAAAVGYALGTSDGYGECLEANGWG